MSQNGLYTLAVNNNVGGGATGSVYLSTLTNVGLVTNGRIGIGTTNPASSLHIIGPYASGGLPVLGSTSHSSLIITQQAGQYGLNVVVARESGAVHMQSQYFNGTAAYLPLTLNPMGGNVGIGTTNPSYLLTAQTASGWGIVQQQSDTGPKVGFFTGGGDAYVGTITAHNLYFCTTNSAAQMTLQKTTGYVGIGLINPAFPLHVSGSNTSAAAGAGYWFSVTQTFTYSASYNFGKSIYATSGIVSGDYVGTASDIRIKKNIIPLTNSLSILQNIDIVSYDKIDYREKGADAGVIAQKIKDILPRSIIKDERIIPNIYSTSTHSKSDGIVNILVSCNQSDIKEGSTVRIIILKGNKEEKYETTMVNWTGASFDVAPWDNYSPDDKVFVYGTKVDDFLSVDKDQIGMLAAAGVKELHPLVIQQAEKIASLESQLAAQTSAQASAIALLEARLAALEAK
jgi:hypothetical protein